MLTDGNGVQTAVNVAVTGGLKRANAQASQAAEPGEVSPSQLADHMYVLCRWRDERARALDEGTLFFADGSICIGMPVRCLPSCSCVLASRACWRHAHTAS